MKKINISTKTHPNTFALVDDADFKWLNQWKWCAVKYRHILYVMRKERIDAAHRRTVTIHRLILGLKFNDGLFADHRDGDGLNNQRANLRIATNQQNQQNSNKQKGDYSSEYKGVTWSKKEKKWQANITFNGRLKHLGLFHNEIDAAKAYNEAAIEHFGEFARLNDV